MNVELQKKQEHIREDLQSMQKSLEDLKSSLENDATLATKQEFVSFMKDMVLKISNVDNDQTILALHKQLENSGTISNEMLESVLSALVSLRLAYVDTGADQSTETFKKITDKKAELDNLLSSIKNPESYQIDPDAPVVADDAASGDVDDDAGSDSEEEPGWLMRNTKAIFSKEEWSKDWKTNTLRTASGLAITGGAVWGIKKLWGLMTGDKKESSDKSDEKKGMSWWKKGLLAVGGIGAGWGIWKNWDKIKEWLGFSEKLSFDDALKKVQGDINNISEIDIKTGIGEITYNEASKEIQSYKNVGTKIDKSSKKIPGLDIDFSDYEQMIFTANFVNYLKYHNKGKGVNSSPFFVGKHGGNIYMKTNVGGKEQDTDVLSGGVWSTLANFAPDVDGGILKKTLSFFGLKDNKGKEKLVAYLNGLDVWEKGDAPNQENPNNDPIVAEANEVHDDIRDTIHDIEQHGITRGTIKAEKVPGKDMYNIQSWDGSTKIEILSGGEFRVEAMDIIIPTANEAIRIANFSNKMQKENANQGATTAPFSYEREYGGWKGIYIELKRSPNLTSDKMRVLTDDMLKSTMPTINDGDNEKYLIDYLNGIKNNKGKSIWN